MPELTPEQLAQLDTNIKNMLANGASQDDVVAYATDFKAKYSSEDSKKKVSTEPSTGVGVGVKQSGSGSEVQSASTEKKIEPITQVGEEFQTVSEVESGKKEPQNEYLRNGATYTKEEYDTLNQSSQDITAKKQAYDDTIKEFQKSGTIPSELIAFRKKEYEDAVAQQEKLVIQKTFPDDEKFANFYDLNTMQPMSVPAKDYQSFVTDFYDKNLKERFDGKSIDDLSWDEQRVLNYQFGINYLKKKDLQSYLDQTGGDVNLGDVPHAWNQFGQAAWSGISDMVNSLSISDNMATVDYLNAQFSKAYTGAISKDEYNTEIKSYGDKLRSQQAAGLPMTLPGVNPSGGFKVDPVTNQEIPLYTKEDVDKFIREIPPYEDAVLKSGTGAGLSNQLPYPQSNMFRDLANKLDKVIAVVPNNPKKKDSFVLNDIPQALGSSAGFALTGFLGIPELSFLTGAMQNASSTYKQAIELGASPEEAQKAFVQGLGVGTSEGAPIELIFRGLTNKFGSGIAGVIISGLAGGTAESIQEGLQGVANREILDFIDENRQKENIGRSMGAAAVTGLLMGMASKVAADPNASAEEKKVAASLMTDLQADLKEREVEVKEPVKEEITPVEEVKKEVVETPIEEKKVEPEVKEEEIKAEEPAVSTMQKKIDEIKTNVPGGGTQDLKQVTSSVTDLYEQAKEVFSGVPKEDAESILGKNVDEWVEKQKIKLEKTPETLTDMRNPDAQLYDLFNRYQQAKQQESDIIKEFAKTAVEEPVVEKSEEKPTLQERKEAAKKKLEDVKKEVADVEEKLQEEPIVEKKEENVQVEPIVSKEEEKIDVTPEKNIDTTEEKPSLSEIKSDVIEKIPEAVESVKEKTANNKEADKKLKVQKDDLVGQLDKAQNIIDTSKNMIEAAKDLKKNGFEVKKTAGGTLTHVVFDVEGDGVFKLNASGLKEAKSEIQKLWPTKTEFKTPSNERNVQAKLKPAEYATKAQAESNKETALANLEQAKKVGDKKQIELFQKQAEVESKAYQEALDKAKSVDAQIKQSEKIKEVESVYDVDRLLELPKLREEQAKWEGKEVEETPVDYDKIESGLKKLKEKYEQEFDDYTKPLRRQDNGRIKASISKSQQYDIEIINRNIAEVESKQTEIKELKPKENTSEKSNDRKKAAKDAVKKAKEELNNLGIADNENEKRAKLMAAYTDLAIIYVEEGIKSAVEFAKELGEELSDIIKEAWDNAVNVPDKEDGNMRKKTLLNRAYEGEGQEDEVLKVAIEEIGLEIEKEPHSVAKKKALNFIETVGEEAALKAVQSNKMDGAAAAAVWMELVDSLNRQKAEVTDEEEYKKLSKIQASLINDFSQKATDKGRFISYLQNYSDADFNYNAEKQIEDWKKKNNGEISPEQEAKFYEQQKQIEELTKKVTSLEEKQKEAEEKAAVEAIKESVSKKKKVSIRDSTKKIADEIRKGKLSRPGAFMASTPGAIVWDSAIEVVAQTVEASGKLADAIAKGIEYIKSTEWYKNHTDKDQVEKQFLEHFEKNVEVIKGKLKIPHELIRELVESGVDNITDLTNEVLKEVKKTIPDATERQVRDAITQYGRTLELNPEPIETEIRKIKRIGRAISALEDIRKGKRAQRSGLQRDVTTPEERVLLKQIKQESKNLPIDTETLKKEQKTALDAIKTRLTNQIEDYDTALKNKTPLQKTEKETQYDDEAKDLVEKRDAIKKIYDETFGDDTISDEVKIERIIKAVERAEKEVNRQIAENDLAFKTKPELGSEKLTKAREQLKGRKEILNDLREKAGILEERKIEQTKKALIRQRNEYQHMLDNSIYKRRKRTPQIFEDDALIQARIEKQKVKDEWDEAVYQNLMQNRHIAQKGLALLGDAWDVFRILKATGELSPVLVQGAYYTTSTILQLFRNPKQALKAFGILFAHLGSQKVHDAFQERIKVQDWYHDVVKGDKLAITGHDYKLKHQEEQFIGKLVDVMWSIAMSPFLVIPGKYRFLSPLEMYKASQRGEKNEPISVYKRMQQLSPAKAFERGATGFMNFARLSLYFRGVEFLNRQGKTRITHPQDYKDLASIVNTLTGRTSLGLNEWQSKIATKVFFSPKMWASTAKTMTPYMIYEMARMTSAEGGNTGNALAPKNFNEKTKTGKLQISAAQKIAFEVMLTNIGLTTAILLAFKMNNPDDDDDKPIVELDPRSADFMKLKVGDTRVDPWGGRQQMVVFEMRLMYQAMGYEAYKSSTSGKLSRLGEGYTMTPAQLFGRMAENKLAPTAAFLYKDFLNPHLSDEGVRQDAFGNPISLNQDMMENLYPIYWGSLQELYKDNPENAFYVMAFLGFFGMGSQTYDTTKKAELKKVQKVQTVKKVSKMKEVE